MLHPQLSKGSWSGTLAGGIVWAQSNENLGPGHATRHHGHSYPYAVKTYIEHGVLELSSQLTRSILNNQGQTARAGGAAIHRATGGGLKDLCKIKKRHVSGIVSCWVRIVWMKVVWCMAGCSCMTEYLRLKTNERVRIINGFYFFNLATMLHICRSNCSDAASLTIE